LHVAKVRINQKKMSGAMKDSTTIVLAGMMMKFHAILPNMPAKVIINTDPIAICLAARRQFRQQPHQTRWW